MMDAASWCFLAMVFSGLLLNVANLPMVMRLAPPKQSSVNPLVRENPFVRETRGWVEMPYVGRDHSPGTYTLWIAGGGVKRGFSYGETDQIGHEAAIDKVIA